MTTVDARGAMASLPRGRDRKRATAWMIYINTRGVLMLDTPLPGTMNI